MAKKTKESKKIKGLVRIGVFSALWIAVSWAIACSIAFFAPVLLVLPCILALFGGLIYTVELSKLEIPGGVLVPSLLLGVPVHHGALRNAVHLLNGGRYHRGNSLSDRRKAQRKDAQCCRCPSYAGAGAG